MIDTLEQAQAVQRRRVASGRRGRAKAVRRFILREYRRTKSQDIAPWSVKLDALLPADFHGCGPFREDHAGAAL